MRELIPFLVLPFYFVSLKWITDLQKSQCICSRDWRQRFIKYFYMFAILVALATIGAHFSPALKRFDRHLHLPLVVISTVYVAVALSYVLDLQKKHCDCAKSEHEKFIYWTTLIQVVIISVILAATVYASKF